MPTRMKATPPKKRLPADPDEMNDARADWADVALVAFMAETGTEQEDAICDLVADLRHWCDRHGMDFERELARGNAHYDAETTSE